MSFSLPIISHLCGFASYIAFWYVLKLVVLVKRYCDATMEVPPKMARLGRILFRHKRCEVEIARREDFVTIDNGIVSLDELKGEKWTVYTLDKHGAVFVELPKPVHTYTINHYPFIFLPMFEQAVRTAEMTLTEYENFANELEVENSPPRTLFFTNTARCASTLFGAMLQHQNKSVVLGEPHVLTVLAIGYDEGYWSEDSLRRLLPATIKVFRKCIPSDQLLVLKTTSTEARLVPWVRQTMPEVKNLFMFRRNCIDSVERALAKDPIDFAVVRLYCISPFIATFFGFLSCAEGKLYCQFRPTHVKEWATLIYGSPYKVYKENEDCFDFPIVWHDELISSTEKVLMPIYEELGLSVDDIPRAVEKMNRDSQAGTFMSQDALRFVPVTELTPALRKRLLHCLGRLQIDSDISGISSL